VGPDALRLHARARHRPADATPVVVVSGGNFPNPLSLPWFAPGLDDHRVYAPDTIGHPGKSDQVRLSPRDASSGWWLADVLDELGLPEASMVGPSFGAGITLALATVAPERIERAALVVPAGIINPPLPSLLARMGLPMLAYRLRPSRARLVRAVRPLFAPGDDIDEAVLDAVGAVFDHVRIEPVMPRARRPSELADLTAPVLVVAAEHDPLFPGERVLARARELFPNLAGAELLHGGGHVPTGDARHQLQRRLRSFQRETT
jgi:pimeloyl-ACP methyl ester carboxylesterase